MTTPNNQTVQTNRSGQKQSEIKDQAPLPGSLTDDQPLKTLCDKNSEAFNQATTGIQFQLPCATW
jgi:hypothetical protein